MTHMVHEVFGDLLLVLHTAALPTDEEWRAYLDTIANMQNHVRQLVFTDGGGPTTNQRAALVEVLRDKINTGSVISSNRIIRHVVTAINWLGPHNVRSFAPHELDRALEHLGVLESEVAELMAKVTALAARLDGPLESFQPPNAIET
jgi:hypothetical protein